MRVLALLIAALVILPAQAQARHAGRHHHHHHAAHHKAHKPMARAVASRIVSHPVGCPRVAFCGCGVARHFGLHDRSLWLAANWLRFPRATPAPGMAAARNGHVFAILKVIGRGVVLAFDPNSGHHLTRIHERRLAGFAIVNPHGRFAAAPRHRVRLAHYRPRGQDRGASDVLWRNDFAKVF